MAFHTDHDSCSSASLNFDIAIHNILTLVHLQAAQVTSYVIFDKHDLETLYFRRRLKDAYEKDIWEAGRKMVSAIWDSLGWFWHGRSLFLKLV